MADFVGLITGTVITGMVSITGTAIALSAPIQPSYARRKAQEGESQHPPLGGPLAPRL